MRYQCPPSIIAESVGGKNVLLHIEDNKYFGLNTTAFWLWERLCDGHNLEACVNLALESYDEDDREVLFADFKETLDRMLDLKILEVAEG